MTLKRPRVAAIAAGVASITFALTACAPTGQPGPPGVSAVYEGAEITNAHVNEVSEAWVNDTHATDIANRRQVLTIELLRKDLIKGAADAGVTIHRSDAKTLAEAWLKFKGISDGTPSDDMIDAVWGIAALYVVASADPSLATLRDISDHVAASAVVSPRAGVYSTDALIASVQAAIQSANNQQLQQYSFTEFQNVSAFTDENRSWLDRG